MSKQQLPPHDGDGDADLAALLRAVGSRTQPPAEATAEVRAALAAEWRAVVASRKPARRRLVRSWVAVAASVATVATAVSVMMPRWIGTGPPDAAVASVAIVSGAVAVRHSKTADWRPLAADARIAAHDEIRTAAAGRVALQRPDGLEIRLDENTQLAFDGGTRASLDSGSVYIDSGTTGARVEPFVVRTPLGEVRHLGTQYVASLEHRRLHVAVREGQVAVGDGRTPVVAGAGETLLLTSNGAVARGTIPRYGDAWHWAESLAPGFAIEGRSLDEFLAWAARETGRELVYASPNAAREAATTRLNGSVAGLAPETAVAAVMSSEPALQLQIAGGRIEVELAHREVPIVP
jgi:ferric-dicitrate binding protein FerR (iron transport regulator)